MTFIAMPASDELRHPDGEGTWWGESWYFDWVSPGGDRGGYVRLGIYPNLGVAWYWACLVGPGQPLILVQDHSVPVPASPSLEVRTTGLWADHNCEEPFARWSLGLESFGLRLDDARDALVDEPRGEQVPFGLEMEWESEGAPFRYTITDRYEVPCRVHGKVTVGDETIEVDTIGQRDHSWGARDWWQFPWVWSAFHVDDGTHLFGNSVPLSPEFTFMTGYRQGGPAGGDPVEVEDFPVEYTELDDGLVTGVTWELDGVRAQVTPLAWAPLLLVANDGRRGWFPRAMCRAELDDGRQALGWMEFNRPSV